MVQRRTVWRSTGWSPNRTEQLKLQCTVFWYLWDVGCYGNFSSETETLTLTEQKPASQKKSSLSSQNTGANISKHQCWSYLVSSVLRNRLCTIFLSSSVGATFSREAVLSSTRRSLLARDHEAKQTAVGMMCKHRNRRGSRRVSHSRKFGVILRSRMLACVSQTRTTPKGLYIGTFMGLTGLLLYGRYR